MIVEYTIGKIKELYDKNNENIDIELIENILSDNIDNDYINSPIIHIFPIIFSTSITLLFAAYLLLQ